MQRKTIPIRAGEYVKGPVMVHTAWRALRIPVRVSSIDRRLNRKKPGSTFYLQTTAGPK